MKAVDFLKAAGVALALLAINVLIGILVVAVYAVVIEPGHPHEFYEEAATRIVPWSCHIVGTVLFFVTAWRLTAHKPERNGYVFATAVIAMYAILDGASVGFSGIWGAAFAYSMLAKLLAALAGAYIATRANASVPSPTEP